MMIHSKKEHIEKVAICWNFAVGICEMGDDSCWFSHKGQPNDPEHVPACRNSANKNCWYGPEKCWFRHEESEANHKQKNAINENETITVKIFDMMENFTKKIMEIENKMENTRN
jgi:hypothetical protein